MGSQATIQYTQSVQDYTGNRKPITMEQDSKNDIDNLSPPNTDVSRSDIDVDNRSTRGTEGSLFPDEEMGDITTFNIRLSGSHAKRPVYRENEQVEGNVILDLPGPLRVKVVTLLFHGGAKVHWSEKHTTGTGKTKKTRTVHFRNSETYFKQTQVLFGKDSGITPDAEGYMELSAGRHEYPFNFTLPGRLPTSFEGTYGQVRYHLLATVDGPKRNRITREPFTVLGNLDLNKKPECKLGAGDSQTKTMCCLCCATGPIMTEVKIERTGFVPGEYIFATAAVDNHSRRRMSNIRLILTKEVVFYSSKKSRRLTNVIRETKLGHVEPWEKKDFINKALRVPPLPPSGLSGCKIMSLKYFFKMVIDPEGPGFDIVMPMDVTIGTVPLSDAQQYYNSHTDNPTPTENTENTEESKAPAESFEEVEGGTTEAQDVEEDETTASAAKGKHEEFGETSWAPIYTFFSFGFPMGAKKPESEQNGDAGCPEETDVPKSEEPSPAANGLVGDPRDMETTGNLTPVM